MLPVNEGNRDRILRIVVGGGLIGRYARANPSYGLRLLIPGIILILTGVTGRCGLYTLFGVSTCKITPKKGTTQKS